MMVDYIKEVRNGFGFDRMNSHSFQVNQAKEHADWEHPDTHHQSDQQSCQIRPPAVLQTGFELCVSAVFLESTSADPESTIEIVMICYF